MGRHKLRTFFMMLGILVGISALTLIFAIGKGTQERVMANIEKVFDASSIMINAGGNRMMGGPQADGLVTTLTIADLEAIAEEVPAIVAWDPMHIMPAREVKYRDRSANIRVLGHSPAAEEVWNRSVIEGRFFDAEDMEASARVALIGQSVVDELFADVNPLDQQIRISNIPFRVIGVLELVGPDPHGMNRDFEIYIPITTAMRRVLNVDYIFAGKFLVSDPALVEEAAARSAEILRQRHALTVGEPDDFSIMTPVEVKEMIQRALQVFNLFLPILAGLSLLVGGVVVANLMLISVSERTAEIGLRRAVGARATDIQVQFLLETVVITVAGGIVGLVVGIGGVRAMAGMMNVPVAVPLIALVLGIAVPSVVGLVAGVVPARRAAALEPVEALR
ncbi:MAG: ABC transporter permease [Gemmatimonadales bacterium]|jgi:putative ABC transport system permease protein